MDAKTLLLTLSVIAVLAPASCAPADAKAPSQAMHGAEADAGLNGIKEGDTLTLDGCIEIALRNQPGMLAAKNTVLINRSKALEAASNYYPQIDLSAGYSRTSPAGASTSRSLSSSGKSYDYYSNSLTLTQNIYDFGKTGAEVRASELTAEASRADLDNTAIQTVFNVKQAYYNVLQAKRSLEVARDTVRQFEAHLDQARGFFEVGMKPKFDVTKAEADLGNSRVNLIKAENALRLARSALNNAMGVIYAPGFEIVDTLSYRKYDVTLADALKKAFEARPDVRSSAAKKKSAEASLTVSEKGYYPSVTGNAAYSQAGERYPLDDGWNVGATITIPIFSGFLTRHQVSEAKASLGVASANEEAARQNAFFDVQQTYLNLKDAEERIPAAELALKQAEENLDVANGRYSAGVGGPIEVTDAQVSLINAKTAYIQALTDYKIAEASMEKAMGLR